MNIIIPCAGIGSRFKEDGYEMPKPLINVLGEPLIFHVIDNLSVDSNDVIYIAYNQSLDSYSFCSIIRKGFPALNIKFVPLNYYTRGACETVLCCLNKIDDLSEKTLILDCDTFYTDDIVTMARCEEESCIFYFDDAGKEPIFSYIKIRPDHSIEEIEEKNKISDNACTGAYSFKDGNILKKYCETALNKEAKSLGEYYMSTIYALMIADGEEIMSYGVKNFHCLGTPNQLKTFCVTQNTLRKGVVKTFCFDLDGTLCTHPNTPNDYSTVEPIHKNIKKLKYLHSLGHHITIQTARKMKSSHGNAGRAAKLAHKEVYSFLERYEIPFDEIYFGKPFADFYIDDLSVSPYKDIDKQIGFYDANVEPRHFNNIEYKDHYVIKTTNNKGEIYWYEHIPQTIAQYFPSYNLIDKQKNTIQIPKIDGVPFSYLFINNSLTKKDIELLFSTMHEIHECEVSALPLKTIYENYLPKTQKRYQENEDLYDTLTGGVIKHSCVTFIKIKEALIEYEEKRMAEVGIIHGDMVFSNIFLCENRLLKFIDMRGKVGDTETICGDIFYDYAKVYQSLCGYDFILNDVEINKPYANELKSHFEKLFVEKFSEEYLSYLKIITASLLFTLIPLHTDIKKQRKYLDLSKSLIHDRHLCNNI